MSRFPLQKLKEASGVPGAAARSCAQVRRIKELGNAGSRPDPLMHRDGAKGPLGRQVGTGGVRRPVTLQTMRKLLGCAARQRPWR
jgi:hypothetical protein